MKKLITLFLCTALTISSAWIVLAGESPGEYTQMKVFDGTYGFGPAQITAYTNDDCSEFYITFFCFGEDQILEGTVEDGIVTVTYDLSGFMGGDAQKIWDDAMADEQPWTAAGAGAATDDAEGKTDETAEDITEEQDIQNYLWEIPKDAGEEEYIKLMERNYRIIQAFELLFTEESYKAYSDAYNRQYKRSKSFEDAQKVVEAQELLVQKSSVADGSWILWGTDPVDNANGYGWFTDSVAPVTDEEKDSLSEEALDASAIDGFGQGPVLIKCLLDDPAQAKGNVILVSGGGFFTRSNGAEGYAAIPVFQELGYNCFLLQRRVAPYATIDIFMDLQRAVRIVRKAAEENDWGGQDMIAAAGFSGGGGTILGTVNHCYGDLTPADYGVSSYVTDEIDSINGDLDVAMIIYGAAPETIGTSTSGQADYAEGYTPVTLDNIDWPAFYICHGMADDTVPVQNSVILYDWVKDKVPAQLYLVPDAKHGFGPGTSSTAAEGCRLWPGQADEFMQNIRAGIEIGELPLPDMTSIDEGEEAEAADEPSGENDIQMVTDIPDVYSMVKIFDGTYGFGEAEITAAANSDLNAFFITFFCFGENQILEGTVDDGIVTVTYDLTGFMGGDAQKIWDDAMANESPWTPVK